ncbi:tetratricopeptide repeat protein [Cytophagaceae bacterium DM2B3-1]|uniref:Tetratricopeptide repeat protein n=1 Tax=Xanthocytophaga flava TaxID=3048013 RepID=A0ABT7CTI0_9BACT|nr:tetratricopeptide repeat protein [Xanthocytophaga flavus]MDJ1467927.1 tetratricopeptide repeat protein [Xanthocytophaga flavus]MDJ1497054.1 tetratricopeptide repeat protein [Xanthocytophaga flavus]
MRHTALLFLLVIISLPSNAQTSKKDSLENLLQLSKQDTSQIKLLNELAYEYWSTDPERMLSYIEKALTLSNQLSYKPGQARSQQLIGVYHWQKSEFKEAIIYFTKARQLYRAIHDQKGEAKSIVNLGMVYKQQGNDVLALDKYFQGLELLKDVDDKDTKASILNNIGNIYKNRQENGEAISFFQQALTLWKQINRQQAVAGILSNLSEVYLNQKQYDQALKSSQEALAIFEKLHDTNGEIICHNNQGKIYLKKNSPETALQKYQTALELNATYQKKNLLASSHNGLGAAYTQLKQYTKAIGHYQQAYQLSSTKNMIQDLQNSCSGLALVYAQTKNYENAFRFLQQYENIKDSLFSQESGNQLTKLRVNYENEKKQIEINLLQKEKELAQSTRNLIGLGMGALLVIALLVLYQQQSNLRKKKELLVKNEELYKAQQALAQAELNNSQLREGQLLEQLEFRNKSLTTHTLNMIQKNSIMEEIRETVSEVLKSAPKNESSSIYSRLMKLVDYSFSLDKDWDDFKMYFEQVHHEFFSKLKESHPELSSGELKLCALVRLNMNLKESATVLGISPESVKTARYRLRKKLELEEETNLTDYLLSY